MAVLTLEQKLDLGASDLRFLLTNHGIKDDHQGALFEAGVDTVAKFAAFVTTAADLVEVLKKEFSLDPATSLANRAQVASYTVAWQSAQARTKQQAEVEATSETREWAKPIPTSDYIAMRQRFAKAFGEPEDRRIPAKEYIEKKLAELEAHLSVKKGSSSVAMPTGPEQLRLRLTVMCNALAMIKLKHPGRNEFTDINADLIEKYKDFFSGGLRLWATVRGGRWIDDPPVDASAWPSFTCCCTSARKPPALPAGIGHTLMRAGVATSPTFPCAGEACARQGPSLRTCSRSFARRTRSQNFELKGKRSAAALGARICAWHILHCTFFSCMYMGFRYIGWLVDRV